MKSLIIFVSLLASIAQSAPTDTQLPVCIIGAGPAGLTTAVKLQEKGYNTIIFEKQAQVGGKCQAYYDTAFHPLGALVYVPNTYRETVKAIKISGVPSRSFPEVNKGYYFNQTTGQADKITIPSIKFGAQIVLEVARYSAQWALHFSRYADLSFDVDDIPADLTLPTAEWLDKNKYSALKVLFTRGMVAYGYGDYRVTPVLYMLQYFTPEVLLALTGVKPPMYIDFHAVWVNYAQKSIKGPILLNSSISQIDRSGVNPAITYTTNNSTTQQQQCNSIVLAFPPTLSALTAANLDITPAEQDIFNLVSTTAYWSGAVRMSNIPTDVGFAAASMNANVPPEGHGQPVDFVRTNGTSNVVTTWSWAEQGSNITTSTARELLKTVLSKVNKDPNVQSAQAQAVTDDDVKAFVANEYFPHFGTDGLNSGVYKKFYGLQGLKDGAGKKTYYASGLNGLETVEFAVRAGGKIVDKYF